MTGGWGPLPVSPPLALMLGWWLEGGSSTLRASPCAIS